MKKFSIISGIVGTLAVVAAVLFSNKNIRRTLNERLHSREASTPAELPKTSWKQALLETKDALGNKNIPMLAAGVAFFFTLAFFPTLTAFISIFSLAASPDQVEGAVKTAEAYLPHEMAGLVTMQLSATAGKQTTNLIAAIIAIILALWGASGGVQNLMKAINEMYDLEETRSFIKLKLVSLALVLFGILIGFPLLFLLIVQGDWLTSMGAPEWLASGFLFFRWVLITAIMIIGLAAFYRYGPDRKNAKWQWVSWGAVMAIIIWLLGTLLFFFYAQNLSNFSENYGIFAGIIVLMTWLNLSSLIVLLGAQVNSRLEAKTSVPTTEK